MNLNTSQTNLVIITKKHRIILFSKLYWRSLIIIITPLLLLPVTLIGQNHAYPCFFLFLVTAVYWVADVLHPAVISMIPLAWYSVISADFFIKVNVCNELLNCLGIMMLMAAVENSGVHKRLALKLLLTVGCSHYRLSLVLFFSAMFLSMWVPDTVACGVMMPLVKALLQALEKMGIVEMYHTIDKSEQKSHKHEMSRPKPTDITIFYFLGTAYSCSIGGMATLYGSQANQIFKEYSEIIFCDGLWENAGTTLQLTGATVSPFWEMLVPYSWAMFFPKLAKTTFPQFMLLTLPGVLATETLLYIWMNSYFLKVFKLRGNMAIPTGLNEEEARYIKTLARNQYTELGKIKFHDMVVAATVLLTIVLQVVTSISRLEGDPWPREIYMWHVSVSAPSILCVFILFVVPTDLNFLNFFKNRNHAILYPLPTAPSKACLNWPIVREKVMWSVLFTIGGSCMSFEALKHSGMTEEFGNFLLMLRNCPSSVLALVVILCCKTLTEFTSKACVAYALLPEVAKLSIHANHHPHHLMLAATLSSSMSSHLVPSSPCMAMVSQYIHIPVWRMMAAGVGPSTIAVVVTWFTVTLWSKVILPQ